MRMATYKGKKFLGLITARGGSKGVPGKNIKMLGGKPLLAYTILAAKKSGIFDRIIISTDDEVIASVAREWGAEVPFIRPPELAQDSTPHFPVVKHTLEFLAKENYQPDYAVILQPTSPFRLPRQLQEAADIAIEKTPDSVLSVMEVPPQFNPTKQMQVREDGVLRLFNSALPIGKRIARRQDLPRCYMSAALFYMFRSGLIFEEGISDFYGETTLPYFVEDPRTALDIDTMEDWEKAEKLFAEMEAYL